MEPIGELSDAAKAEIARLAEQAERARASVGGTGDATAYVRAVLGSIPENFRSLIAEDWLEHWPHRAELAAVEEPVIEAETARLLARLDAEIPEAHKAMDVLLSRLRTTRIPAAQSVALGAVGNLWAIARKIDDLLSLHKKVEESLQVIDERLRALEDRMLKLEAGQAQVFTEARNAATVMASGVISEAVTRITRLEGRADRLEKRRLPPPT